LTLSIIIVSYNVSDYLRQCLSAIYDSTIIDQTEIIVIDNEKVEGVSSHKELLNISKWYSSA